MSKTAFNSLPKLTLADGGVPLLVEGNGIEVEFKDGQVFVRAGTVNLSGGASLADGASPAALTLGAKMADGSVYAGVSPDTGKPMYATPKDARVTCNFNEAAYYAANLDAHGRQNWRVPTKAELNVLFQNRAAIGGFDTTGSRPTGWYCSSSRNNHFFAWTQRFSDGGQHYGFKSNASALRCVRG